MYIGTLKPKTVEFLHAGTGIPFPACSEENGISIWNWDTIFDTALDIKLTLEQSAFIGAVTVKLAEKKALKKIEVLVGGATVGAVSAEIDRLMGGEITVSVGKTAEELVLRLYASMENVVLEGFDVLGAIDDQKPFVSPQPKAMRTEHATEAIADIVAATEDCDEAFAASFLKERLTERHGSIPRSTDGLRIVFVKDTSGAYDQERYTVNTDGKTLTVTAASRLALLYGADTLLQISTKEGLPCVEIDDKPSKEFRGLHIGLPSRENFEFVRRMFRYLLIPLRFNLLIVQFTAGMRFDKHPEISEAWLRATENFNKGIQPKMPHSSMIANGTVLEKHEVTQLLNWARELGLEIVPEIQSFGHVQYITYAHPELSERIETPDGDVDTRADDVKPVGFYPHCYCPSLQASYDLIYDIIDEIVEVAKPSRYVHMGHDEIHHIGRCHRCQTANPTDLYVKHVTAMYDYLKKKGLDMMIWSDMIHTDPARKYYVPDARDRLPKDILMLDFVWYFRPELDIEEELLPYGYTLAIGNLYSSHFTRYRSRVTKDGMIGGQISLWLPTEEQTVGEKGKLWDMMYLSEMLWNAEAYEERNRATYTHLIASQLQPRMRDELRGTYTANGYKQTALPLPAEQNKPFAPLATLCPNAMLWSAGEITPNATFDRLIFEHATVWNAPIEAWDPTKKIGAYVVTYENGAQETVDVCYGKNIMRHTCRYAQPMPHKYYRHTGYVGTWFADPAYEGHASDGSPLTVLGYAWQNPHPDQKIVSISYQSEKDDICGLILVGIRGEIKN